MGGLMKFGKSAASGIPGVGSGLQIANKVFSSLGLGPPQWKSSRTYKLWDEAWQRAKAGDRSAHYWLYLLTFKGPLPNSQYTEVLTRARDTMSKLGYAGWSKTSREPGQVPPQLPLSAEFKSWPVSSRGPVPGVALGKTLATIGTSVLNARPVLKSGGYTPSPSQGRTLPPCKYGPRDADGRCPKAPAAGRAASAATARGFANVKAKAQCKYGPRGADGFCPKKPAAARSARTTKAQRAVQRRLESSVTKGVTSAGRAIVKSAGGAAAMGKFVLKAGLIGAAGVAAYLVTTQLMKLRYNTYDDLRFNAANAYRKARADAVEVNGRGLTPAEGSQLAQWFKAKLQLLDTYERQGKKISGVANLTFKE